MLKIIPSDRLVIDWRGVEKWGKIDYIVRRRINCSFQEGAAAAAGPCQEQEHSLSNGKKGCLSSLLQKEYCTWNDMTLAIGRRVTSQ
jgi:hypothetical protein